MKVVEDMYESIEEEVNYESDINSVNEHMDGSRFESE